MSKTATSSPREKLLPSKKTKNSELLYKNRYLLKVN